MRTLAKSNTVPGTRPARAINKGPGVESQIQILAGLDIAGLRDRWRRTFERQAPAGVGRDFIVRALAYHLQAEALGDLDSKTIRTLKQLAGGDTDVVTRDRTPGRNLHPGTELIRDTTARATTATGGSAFAGARALRGIYGTR